MDVRNLRSPCSEEIRELLNPHFSFTCGRVRTPTGDLLFLYSQNAATLQVHPPCGGFQVDEAPTNHPHTAELFATVRDNGRIINDTRMVLGGSEIFEACFKLGKIFKFPGFKDWSLHLQRWGRDLDLRKGLLSGLWQDVSSLVSMREADVIDENGAGIGHAKFLRLIGDPDDGAEQAAIRWAVALNDRGRLVVQIQGLPASAASLNGKPSLRR